MNKQTQTQTLEALTLDHYTVEALTLEDITIEAPAHYYDEEGENVGIFAIIPLE